MSQYGKLLARILSGTNDSNISFDELQRVLTRLGFDLHVRGGHFIYAKPNIEDIINIQPLGNKAKAYQVKQVRNIILRYKLKGAEEDEV